jgi:multidrug efflux pump subunit AcrA (membrane-fusion protein)
LFAALIISCGKKEETRVEKSVSVPVQGVRIETVKASPVPEDYEAVGTIRSKTTTVLSSKTMGNILAVHVHEGDHVRIGQLLIEIDDRDSRAQLRKAQAGFREVEEAFNEIEQNMRAAESGKEAAEAGKTLALATFNRYRALLEEKSVSQQEFDEVQAKLNFRNRVERAGRMIEAFSQRARFFKDGPGESRYCQRPGLCWLRPIFSMDGIVISKQAEVGLLASPGVLLLVARTLPITVLKFRWKNPC